MADASQTLPDGQQPLSSLPTFVVEFGRLNLMFYVKTLAKKVRGSFRQSVYTTEEGGAHVGTAMHQMPDIPGQRLTVNFRDCKVVLSDPLEGDKKLLNKMNNVARRTPAIKPAMPWGATPPQEFLLSPDKMQTLVEELRFMFLLQKVTMVKGKIPSEDEMAKCEGRILNAVASLNPRKAKYKDQVEAHMRRLADAGVGDD